MAAKQVKRFRFTKIPVVEVMADDLYYDCWIADYRYLVIDGLTLCREWARNKELGDVVRHKCSDNRCINPLHMQYGTVFENADDELILRDYVVNKFADMLDNHSLDNEPKDRAYLIIVPWMSKYLTTDQVKYDLSDTIKYGRELYRLYYVESLRNNIECQSPEIKECAMSLCNERLNWLKARPHQVIIHESKYR